MSFKTFGQTSGAHSTASTNHVLHPALEMSLFAAEPDVVDPVALTFDEAGRMYVVEMRDYPYGIGPELKAGGTIRLLEDRDGDGRADRSVVFAENLRFPTSIAPWKGGVFVTAPPEIIYLKDTDGDGRADIREVVFRGFTLGVTDSNVNGLRWGLDNRIHGSNGGNGGSVTSVRKPGKPVELLHFDFSFDPLTGDIQKTYQSSDGFGLVFDDWGRSFCTYNINHVQHRSIPARYLERFGGFPPTETTRSISDHEEMGRIYPISIPETRVNHPEQSGHFSSAGGVGYLGSTYPVEELRNSFFVGDVVGNLIHRDVLRQDGPAFIASRAAGEQTSEFFASRDSAFRPVGLELGLDGALYLIDMQRDVIEHPDYIPQKVREKIDIRAGENRGRIYRIVPRAGLPKLRSLAGLSAKELVEELSNGNQVRRMTAQRLLVERQEKSIALGLQQVVLRGTEALGRLHALWTLHALGSLNPPVLLHALDDPKPELRENALQLAERQLPDSPWLRDIILLLADDPDGRVRFQAALTAGQIQNRKIPSALARALQRDARYPLTRIAVLSSLRTAADVVDVFETVIAEKRGAPASSQDREALVGALADLAAARPNADRLPAVLRILSLIQSAAIDNSLKRAALAGLDTGLTRVELKAPRRKELAAALRQFLESDATAVVAAAWKLSRRLGLPESEAQRKKLERAKQVTLDNSQPIERRLENLQLLELGSFSSVGETLFALLDVLQPPAVQDASMKALSRFDDTSVAQGIIARWKTLSPAVRPNAITVLLQRVPFHSFLMDAVESEAIKLGELNLDLEQRRRLLRESTPEIKARAAKFIGDEEYSNRKAIVEKWLKGFPADGDAKRGRVVFEKTCAQCHRLNGVGFAVGPDLGALAHRSVEDLLSNILDPNMAIQPNYISFMVELDSGELETGLLQSQSAEAITLLQAQAKQVVIPRAKIKRLQSSGLSLMPEGLEAGYSAQDLRDLIAFVHKPQ